MTSHFCFHRLINRIKSQCLFNTKEYLNKPIDLLAVCIKYSSSLFFFIIEVKKWTLRFQNVKKIELLTFSYLITFKTVIHVYYKKNLNIWDHADSGYLVLCTVDNTIPWQINIWNVYWQVHLDYIQSIFYMSLWYSANDEKL